MTDNALDLDALENWIRLRAAAITHLQEIVAKPVLTDHDAGEIETLRGVGQAALVELADAMPALLALVRKLAAENAELRRWQRARWSSDNWTDGD